MISLLSLRRPNLGLHFFFAAMIVGVVMVLLTGFAKRREWFSPTPGRLIADQSSLTWRSPVDESFRKLASDEATAAFELKNDGGKPVRILRVETTCGCTTPVISNTTVTPGGTTKVEARATPLQIGRRRVTITLHTDSEASPRIPLTLYIVGSRRAPFMGQVQGELGFFGDDSDRAIRKIFADNVELAGTKPTPPILKNDLKWLQISPPKLEKEEPDVTSNSVHRRYSYDAKLASTPPPSDSFSGELFFSDPWEPGHTERLFVHGEILPEIRVIPPRGRLRVGSETGGESSSLKFLVAAKSPVSDLVVEISAIDQSKIKCTPGRSDDGGHRQFTVSVASGRVEPGIYDVLVGRSSSKKRIIVPIAVNTGYER